MSEGWNERKYCNTDDLWRWIQEQARRIENQLIDSKHYNAEGVSAMLLGRREMLTWLCDWLKENETKIEEKK